MKNKVRVLIVDDSASMRMVLTKILDSDPDIEVVGAAIDPLMARDLIKTLNPDVLTLDVEMPRMDGLTFLEKLMRLRPMPVVMVSTLTQKNCDITMQALGLGAVDFVPKPTVDSVRGIGLAADEICAKVKAAAVSRVRVCSSPAHVESQPRPDVSSSDYKLIAVGASTGGTEAILKVLSGLPRSTPPVVIVQHIPAGFSESFARRVDLSCEMTVKVAEHGEKAVRGYAYIAPGGQHLTVARKGADLRLEVVETDRVNLHRPSVDVLFHSVAQTVGKHAVGVMLTGMGGDGAMGMREMHDCGARTIAQDEKSCVVFGMPAKAIAAGAVDEIVSLDKIAAGIIKLLLTALSSKR